jgi:hypothetical protein
MTDERSTPTEPRPGLHVDVTPREDSPVPGLSQGDRIERDIAEMQRMMGHLARDMYNARNEQVRQHGYLQGDLDVVRGVVLTTRDEVAALTKAVAEHKQDLDGIAHAIGVGRTYSGQVKLSLPPSLSPPLPPTILRPKSERESSSEVTFDREEYESLKKSIRDREAEERGAKAHVAQQAEQSKLRRERVLFIVSLVAGLGTILGILAALHVIH